ncbi:MAG: GyrI-like domain-containing protein [Gillisia sp.]
MKIIKYLFFLLLIGIIAGAVYVATKNGDYQMERSVVIKAPVSVVFNEVNNFHNWEDWSPWSKRTEDVIVLYSDTTSGKGASFSWKSESLGKGKITNIKVLPNSSIDEKLFLSPASYADSKSDAYWKFDSISEGTKVTWGIKGEQSFMEKLAYTFKDSSFTQQLKPLFNQALSNLKEVTVEKMNRHSINVDGITQLGGGYYMYTTTASKIGKIPSQMKKMFKDLSNYMEQNNITQLGDPFILFNEWDRQNNSAIYSAGIFTPSLIITPEESSVLNGMLPSEKVVKVTLKGDYKFLPEARDQAFEYLRTNNLVPSDEGKMLEMYSVSPKDTPNPAEWVTEIYIPVTEMPQDNETVTE